MCFSQNSANIFLFRIRGVTQSCVCGRNWVVFLIRASEVEEIDATWDKSYKVIVAINLYVLFITFPSTLQIPMPCCNYLHIHFFLYCRGRPNTKDNEKQIQINQYCKLEHRKKLLAIKKKNITGTTASEGVMVLFPPAIFVPPVTSFRSYIAFLPCGFCR